MNISNYNNNFNKNDANRINNNNNSINNTSANTGKTNKSFGSYFSSDNTSSNQPQINPQTSSNTNTIINNNYNNISLISTTSPSAIQGISPTSTPKSTILTAFTVKIGEAKLGLLNSTDLHPLVQLQFRRKIWRTQLGKGLYPSWKENKRFEITSSSPNSNESVINNLQQNSTLQLQTLLTHSSNNSSTASSGSSSNSSNNQGGQQFHQQLQQYPQGNSTQSDFNLFITLIHISQNEEIELGRSCLNVLEEEKKKKDREQWVCIQTTNNSILGSIQVSFQFEYLMQYLSVNKNSHQTFLSQLKQQQQQLQSQQQQQQQQFQALQQSFPINKRSPSAYSEDPRNDFQKHPSLSLHEQQLGLKQNKQVQQQQQQQIIQQQQHPYYQNGEIESIQYRQQQQQQQQQQLPNKYSFDNSIRINNNNPNSVGSSFSSSSNSKQKIPSDTDLNIQTHPQSISGNELAQKIAIGQKKAEALAEKERQINERFLQAQAENIQLQREQVKLEQSKSKLHSMKEELLSKDQENLQMSNKLEIATRNLEENRRLLQNYAKQYQSLVDEEHAINQWKQTKQAQRGIIQQQITAVGLEESVAKREQQLQIANRAVSRLMIANKYPEISDLMFNGMTNNHKDNYIGSVSNSRNDKNNRNIQHLRVNSWHYGGSSMSKNNNSNQAQYTVALSSLNQKIGTLQQLIFDKNNEIEQLRQSIYAIEDHFF